MTQLRDFSATLPLCHEAFFSVDEIIRRTCQTRNFAGKGWTTRARKTGESVWHRGGRRDHEDGDYTLSYAIILSGKFRPRGVEVHAPSVEQLD